MNLHPVVERSIQQQHTRKSVNTLFQKQAESQQINADIERFLAEGNQIDVAQNTNFVGCFNDGQIEQAKAERRIAASRQRAGQISKNAVPPHIRKAITDAMTGSDGMPLCAIGRASGLTKATVDYNVRKMMKTEHIVIVKKVVNSNYYALAAEVSA